MEKSADAFRTISEVAEDLVLPQHVLRYWEQQFPQIRPLKRAGGRRYYRPADVALLRSIRQLLHDEGYTTKGVQRLLKEQGVRGLRIGAAGSSSGDDGDGTIADDHGAIAATTEALEAVDATPEEAIRPPQPSLDPADLREALASIEECERILLALRRPCG